MAVLVEVLSIFLVRVEDQLAALSARGDGFVRGEPHVTGVSLLSLRRALGSTLCAEEGMLVPNVTSSAQWQVLMLDRVIPNHIWTVKL